MPVAVTVPPTADPIVTVGFARKVAVAEMSAVTFSTAKSLLPLVLSLFTDAPLMVFTTYPFGGSAVMVIAVPLST